MLPKKIFFFFPYRSVGGVSVLFIRMAKELLDREINSKVETIDYEDGYLSSNLNDSRVSKRFLKKDQSILIDEDSIFICQSVEFWKLPAEIILHPKCRILMWHLHPFNVVPGYVWQEADKSLGRNIFRKIVYGLSKRDSAKLLNVAYIKNGLIFMDAEVLEIASFYNSVSFPNPVFVPVPSASAISMKDNEHLFHSHLIRAAWVGRIEDFKTTILKHTISRLAKYCEKKFIEMEFHIVGAGKDLENIEKFTKSLKSKHLNVIFQGTLTTAQLDQFLEANVDLLFAMGTSALEGAKLGIPTVLLDFSYEEIVNDYTFRLLSNTTGYVLGRVITASHCESGNQSLESLIADFHVNKRQLGIDAKNYFNENHEIGNVANKFMKSVNNCKFHYSDVIENKLNRVNFVQAFYYRLRANISPVVYRIEAG
jgi:hypothetical protein